MQLNKDVIKQIDRYVTKLVRNQPRWLRELFESERIRFVMEANSMVLLEVDETLEEALKLKANRVIATYMIKKPCKFIQMKNVH